MDQKTLQYTIIIQAAEEGGYLAFHDYYGDRPELGPTYVIDNLVRKNPAFTFYKNFDQVSDEEVMMYLNRFNNLKKVV